MFKQNVMLVIHNFSELKSLANNAYITLYLRLNFYLYRIRYMISLLKLAWFMNLQMNRLYSWVYDYIHVYNDIGTVFYSFFANRKGKAKGLKRQQSVVRVTTHSEEYPKTPFAQKMYEITSFISYNRLEIFWGTLFTLVLIGIFLERAFCKYFITQVSCHTCSRYGTIKSLRWS